MATTSPPKPWERGGSAQGLGASISQPTTTASSLSAPQQPAPTSSPGAPAIPDRPSSLSAVANRNASTYSAQNTSTMNRPYGSSPYGYGSSPYGSTYGSSLGGYGSSLGGGMYGSSMYGGGGMYGSPYSRMGGMGGMGGMYGSSMYGGGGMYGGGMYGGQPGMPGDPNDPNNSLTNNFAASTQTTFQLIESIVGAFGGFAQMLESTYMATHSSFFAMVSVAEQFGNLKQTLGSVLGIYTLLRWLRTLIAKLTGRPPPADATALTPASFHAFANGGAAAGPVGPDGRPVPRPSKKPFIVFVLAVFGLPYLMGKLIRALAKSHEESMQQQQIGPDGRPIPPQLGPNGEPLPQQRPSFDPAKLDFCKVLYDFPPQEAIANGTFNQEMDLQVKKGDLVAVLDKADPNGNPQTAQQDGAWWRCRARDGRMGYLPAVYLETIQRKPAAIEAGSASRSNTMPNSVTAPTLQAKDGGERAATMSTLVGAGDEAGKKGSLEGFQKAWALASRRAAKRPFHLATGELDLGRRTSETRQTCLAFCLLHSFSTQPVSSPPGCSSALTASGRHTTPSRPPPPTPSPNTPHTHLFLLLNPPNPRQDDARPPPPKGIPKGPPPSSHTPKPPTQLTPARAAQIHTGPLPPGISFVSARDLAEWLMDITLPAAQPTPATPAPAPHPLYGSATFRLRLRFPDNYPIEPPETAFVVCAAPDAVRAIPLHPHIYSNGIICLDLLGSEGWSPVQNVESICVSLQSMLAGNERGERPEGDREFVRRVGMGARSRGLGFVYDDDTVVWVRFGDLWGRGRARGGFLLVGQSESIASRVEHLDCAFETETYQQCKASVSNDFRDKRQLGRTGGARATAKSLLQIIWKNTDGSAKWNGKIKDSISKVSKLEERAERVEIAGREHISESDPETHISGQVFSAEGVRLTSAHFYEDGRVKFSVPVYNKEK
ncbi:hypothetical protein FH972_026300 [Carpinus fangiana]|uniref:Peroxisomal membrane protein PEX13 n=1 Tax=Carpinus fangiana TaxID=176857 RepID=A0A5N6L3Q4_9ROSI|nr:hypothetical protein FH972_026300 [Carpinus fangiana]